MSQLAGSNAVGQVACGISLIIVPRTLDDHDKVGAKTTVLRPVRHGCVVAYARHNDDGNRATRRVCFFLARRRIPSLFEGRRLRCSIDYRTSTTAVAEKSVLRDAVMHSSEQTIVTGHK